MFRFWYRFTFTSMSDVTIGLGEAVYENVVAPQLNAYMGLVFEDICKQWLFEQAKSQSLPFFTGSIGRWWGTNSKTRSQEEIDLMALRQGDGLFAECKWQNGGVDLDVYYELKRKSEMFGCERSWLCIFAKDGFSERLREAGESGLVKLVGLNEMVCSYDR